MNKRKAIVLVTEGVGTGLLGTYGSATSVTPALNRLAANSIVLDQCLLDSFELSSQLRSLWTAAHARQTTAPAWNLWQHLTAVGLSSHLLTDSPEVAKWAEHLGCRCVTLIKVPFATEPAERSEDCNLVQVFVAANELLESDEAPDLLWIHASGLRLPWDAPTELRAAMTDPDDPLPPGDVTLPELELDEDCDPDIVVGWGQVAAAQMAVMDEAIDGLMQTIAERADAEHWTWLFCSTGGRPLGEHGRLGQAQRLGYSEEIAVAAMLRPAGGLPIGWRRGELCQLPDLICSLMAAMELDHDMPEVWGKSLLGLEPAPAVASWPAWFSWAWSSHDDTLWARTPAWSLIQCSSGAIELYVKPEDRWEVNDVADRSRDALELLRQFLPQLQQSTAAGRRTELPALPESLTSFYR